MTAPALTWECISCGCSTAMTTKMLTDGLCTPCRNPAPRTRPTGVGATWGIRTAEQDIALTAAIARKASAQLHTVGWRPVTDRTATPYPGVPPTHTRIEWFATIRTTAGPGFTVTENSHRLPHVLRLHALLVETLNTLGATSIDIEMGTAQPPAKAG